VSASLLPEGPGLSGNLSQSLSPGGPVGPESCCLLVPRAATSSDALPRASRQGLTSQPPCRKLYFGRSPAVATSIATCGAFRIA
jgi:hypothetical protein